MENLRVVKIIKILISFSYFICLFVMGCSSSNSSNSSNPSEEFLQSNVQTLNFKSFEYDPQTDIFTIFLSNKTQLFEGVYEFKISPNGENLVIIKGGKGKEPQVFICEANESCRRITNDDFIKFSPAINNNGDVAWAVSEYSVSESKIVFNNATLSFSEDGCFYDNLALTDKYLVFRRTCFYEPENTKVGVFNIENGSLEFYSLPKCFVEEIKPVNDYLFLIQAFCKDTNSTDILKLNMSSKELSKLLNTTKDEVLYEINSGEKFEVLVIDNTQSSKLLFNALYYLFYSQLSNPFSNSNNFLGRIAWNVSYRLLGLVYLYKKTQYQFLKEIIENTISNLLSVNNEHLNIVDDFNPPYAWTSKKYSIDKSSPLSFQVHDGLIYYAVFKALEIIPELKEKFGDILKEHFISEYNYWERFYDIDNLLYRFPYGAPLWCDGVWLPFNQQNAWGLALIEFIKIFGEKNDIKDRVFELANKFKEEWVYEENKILWHYWPSLYYEGWTENDNISLHTPNKEPSVDTLFEDVSHAALSVLFVIEFHKSFPDEIFLNTDIEGIKNTLKENLIKGNYTFARFISGNETYTQPSIMYLPRFGWVNLASEELKEFYYPLLPMIGPNFDEQTLFYSYSVLADSEGEEEKFCYELDVYDCNATLTQKESHCISSSEMVEIFTEMMLPYYGR